MGSFLFLLLRSSIVSQKRRGTLFGAAFFLLIYLGGVLGMVGLSAFIHPADVSAADASYFGNVEYGDETDYYCTYMSLHDQQTGKPIPTLCEIPQQPTTSLASTASNVPLTAGKPFTGDDYAFGNCTYWVALRRSQIGAPIPNSWGNAATWATYAADDGYTVNHTPSYGAIMQTSDVDGGLGHVAFVESVDPNGTWHISEMNVIGFNEIDDRAMPASSAAQYEFIH